MAQGELNQLRGNPLFVNLEGRLQSDETIIYAAKPREGIVRKGNPGQIIGPIIGMFVFVGMIAFIFTMTGLMGEIISGDIPPYPFIPILIIPFVIIIVTLANAKKARTITIPINAVYALTNIRVISNNNGAFTEIDIGDISGASVMQSSQQAGSNIGTVTFNRKIGAFGGVMTWQNVYDPHTIKRIVDGLALHDDDAPIPKGRAPPPPPPPPPPPA